MGSTYQGHHSVNTRYMLGSGMNAREREREIVEAYLKRMLFRTNVINQWSNDLLEVTVPDLLRKYRQQHGRKGLGAEERSLVDYSKAKRWILVTIHALAHSRERERERERTYLSRQPRDRHDRPYSHSIRESQRTPKPDSARYERSIPRCNGRASIGTCARAITTTAAVTIISPK